MSVVNGNVNLNHASDKQDSTFTLENSPTSGVGIMNQEIVELLNECQEVSVQRTLQKLENQVTSIQQGLENKKSKRTTIAHLDKKLDKILSVLERNGFVIEE